MGEIEAVESTTWVKVRQRPFTSCEAQLLGLLIQREVRIKQLSIDTCARRTIAAE